MKGCKIIKLVRGGIVLARVQDIRTPKARYSSCVVSLQGLRGRCWGVRLTRTCCWTWMEPFLPFSTHIYVYMYFMHIFVCVCIYVLVLPTSIHPINPFPLPFRLLLFLHVYVSSRNTAHPHPRHQAPVQSPFRLM